MTLRKEKCGLIAVPSSDRAIPRKKRPLGLRLGVRKGISIGRYQRSFGMMGSSTARLPANATRRSMSKGGVVALILAFVTR